MSFSHPKWSSNPSPSTLAHQHGPRTQARPPCAPRGHINHHVKVHKNHAPWWHLRRLHTHTTPFHPNYTGPILLFVLRALPLPQPHWYFEEVQTPNWPYLLIPNSLWMIQLRCCCCVPKQWLKPINTFITRHCVSWLTPLLAPSSPI